MNKLLNQKKLSGLGPIGIFAASMIILFIITPSFRSMANFTQILLSASVYMLLAMGMSFAIIIDGIDLSAGSIVGLTGGIACGKSYVARLLRQRGIPVLDADAFWSARCAASSTGY